MEEHDYYKMIYEHVKSANTCLQNQIETALNTLLDSGISLEHAAYMILNKPLEVWQRKGVGLLYKSAYIKECQKLMQKKPFEEIKAAYENTEELEEYINR